MEGGSIELASLRGVRKQYGKVVALDGVDLSLAAGQVLALLGANGAGKSTAVALLLGLMQPDAGEATLFGRLPGRLDARRGAGVMLQSAALQETLKVRELLDLTRSYYPNPRSVADCVALGGLDGLLDRRYGKLSGGQQRRVQFALAVCGNPRVLFLDEPTTGLDIEARQTLWRALRELVAQGCAVLLTTHYLEEAEALADRVTVLAHGRVVAAGAMDEVRRHVSARRIRCLTTLDAARIAAWPEVRSARAVDAALADAGAVDAGAMPSDAVGDRGLGRSHEKSDRVEIVTDAAEDVVRRLLAEDATLSELEVQRAGLADAFLELTREDVSDDAHREAA
ncbi:ABC transporter ATP-binding protein [Luteimonas lutimaris]|uniref:ABC transporter ATP-binding protein n=1 Tax=Luteimonas lutimaris TaxID=698645 RepID=A0ABP7N1J6_9GAMM